MNQKNQVLWEPSREFINSSNLKKYEDWLKKEHGLTFSSYNEIWEWSVENIEPFWESIWNYFDVIHHSPYHQVLSSRKMPGANWFEGATLNYAEHIFRNRSDSRPALIFASEDGRRETVSWNELEEKVAAVQAFLIDRGIGKGDRVAAFIPNIPESIIIFLAVNSLGAIWSCCSPDFGVSTVIDRFSQIEPKLLFATTGHIYNRKKYSRKKEIAEIVDRISSIQETVFIPDQNRERSENGSATPWSDVLKTKAETLSFTPVEFSHPIWVLYSSGTTGKPKAITHSHGGMLLEHLKYMHFQNDVKPGENFFWYTTTGWMMWNFLQASLLAGATPVLYDGSAGYPDLNALWKLAEELPIHHFGTSAPYLVACMKDDDVEPDKSYNLSALRSIGSTGAPLPPEAFDWVYESVKGDIWLCSMSGGTDVCTAFVGGSPFNPVHRGLIQKRGLGCDLRAYDEQGNSITGSLGEMVIQKPMPCMPVFFWGDENYKRYKESYFETFGGKWRHGDWIKLYDNGSLIIQGRSDATLNRKGIRIGTAEIYAILDSINGIKDSLIVNIEQSDADDFMPLFVALEKEADLERLKPEIAEKLKEEGSPRHVPDQIIELPDIPYTLSGKKMEVPVKKVLMGMDVSNVMNRDAMKNPESMKVFINFSEKL